MNRPDPVRPNFKGARIMPIRVKGTEDAGNFPGGSHTATPSTFSEVVYTPPYLQQYLTQVPMNQGKTRARLDSPGNTHDQKGSSWNALPSTSPASQI
jgi:hypothetical protein